MEKKMNNEELQSRREFFKKAAKGALPILGAIALAAVPSVVKATEVTDCYNGCSYGCANRCVSCYGSCQGTCSGCLGGCSSTCQGSCYGRCTGSSYGY